MKELLQIIYALFTTITGIKEIRKDIYTNNQYLLELENNIEIWVTGRICPITNKEEHISIVIKQNDKVLTARYKIVKTILNLLKENNIEFYKEKNDNIYYIDIPENKINDLSENTEEVKEMEIINNVDFSKFNDSFGNLIKEFEVIIYNKYADGEWVEERRVKSSRNYYIVDGHLYNRYNNSLLPLNMDFDSSTCGACYQIGKEIINNRKITGNEILFTEKCIIDGKIKGLSLHKQSYSNNTYFYSLKDENNKTGRLEYNGHNIDELIEAIKLDMQLSEDWNNKYPDVSERRKIILNWQNNILNNLLKVKESTIKEEFYNNEVLTENYYISTNPGNKQLVIIQGNNATINHLQGKTIWKRQEKDIIKDLGHSSIKDYIKHLKKFNFKEIQDITEYKAAESGETSEVNMNLQLLATKKEVKQSRVNKALERHNLAIKRAEHFYNTIDDKIEEYKNANEHLYKYYIELKEIYKTDLIKAIDDKINFINKLDNYNIVQDEGIHEDLQNELKPIYNDYIEGHKEYQIEQLELYNSNTLNFQKKRITHNMIEQYTKYFIYDNKRFMAVKPSKDGIYPSSYYTHVKQYNSLVDVDNRIILFLDDISLEGVQNA